MYEIQLEFSSVEKGFKPMNSLCGGEGKGGTQFVGGGGVNRYNYFSETSHLNLQD